jgi:hypothetical protein
VSYGGAWSKPILRMNDTEEARRALRLVDANDIDLEIREITAPTVCLEWNALVYCGLFGIVDFLMFVGRLPIPGIRKSDRAVDGQPPGFQITI